MFANRMRIQTDQIRFQTADNMKSRLGASDTQALVSRLKSLNTPFDCQVRILDTAQLPAPVGDKIATAPIGAFFLLIEGDTVVAMMVQARDPVAAPPDQQAAASNQSQVNA
jgi:hypothetical protein